MLTEKQQEVFKIIKNYIEKEKIPPTVREIGKIAGLTSPSTVQAYIKILEEKGYIHKLNNRPRSIRVNDKI